MLFCFREYETVYRHESLLEKVPNIQMRMPTFKNLHFLHKILILLPVTWIDEINDHYYDLP